MARRLLLLTSKTSYRIEDFLGAAAELGVDVVVGSDQCRKVAELWKGDGIAVDFFRPDEAAEILVGAAEHRPIDGIVPVGEPQAVVAALVARRLGIPFNPPEAALAARDKLRMREALARAGVPQPAFRAFPVEVGSSEVLAIVDPPVVVKPLLLSGSRGVIRADDGPALEAAIRRLEALLKSPELFKHREREARLILVESFVPGDEVAVEGLVVDGRPAEAPCGCATQHTRLEVLAVFDKPDPLDGPFFEETIYVTPSRKPRHVQDAIASTTERAVRALGAVGGPVHAELRLTASGPVVIEVALRTIGGLCSRALRFGAGVSLEDLVIRHAVGLRWERPVREERASGVMMIPIPRAGVLESVHGVEAARAVPAIVDVVIAIDTGRILVPLPEGHEYLGFLFARGRDPGEVEAALRTAHRELSFEIAPVVVTGGGA